MPGEVSRAYQGVLLLSERLECRRHVFECWRQQLRRAARADTLADVPDRIALATLAIRFPSTLVGTGTLQRNNARSLTAPSRWERSGGFERDR